MAEWALHRAGKVLISGTTPTPGAPLRCSDLPESVRLLAVAPPPAAISFDDRLRFEPGTDFLHTTFGHSLLSRLMEGASDAPFGGMVSTPSDLARQGQALFGDAFVSDAGKDILFTPMALADGRMNPESYAIGWRVDNSVRLPGESRPTLIIHHGGTQPS